jgi:hypothetical protein
MIKAAAVVVFATVLLLAGVTSAPAIAIFSDPATDGFGIWTCLSGCTTGIHAITSPPIPPWQNPAGTSQPSAKWISNDAASGVDGFGPTNGTTVTLRYTYTPTTNGTVSLAVWADDTSGVTQDGGPLHNLFAPNPGPFPTCASSPIGCTPGTEKVFNFAVSGGLAHTLDFDFTQFGFGTDHSPFGFLAAGEFTPSAVPEPATILLLGSALTAAGVFSRKRFRKSE